MRILDERSKAKSTVAQSDVGVSGPSAGPVGQEKEEPVPEEDYSEVAQIMGSTPVSIFFLLIFSILTLAFFSSFNLCYEVHISHNVWRSMMSAVVLGMQRKWSRLSKSLG